MLIGGMILAAPILGPAALISDAADDAKRERMSREWKASMETRLAENDPEAIQECLHECDIRWEYELDYADRKRLQLDAAKRFLAGDWPDLDADQHQAFELLAHYTLSWQPESAQEDARYILMRDHVLKSYSLLKTDAVHAPLKKLMSSTRYNRLTSIIYGRRYAIDTPASEPAARAYFESCPSAIARLIRDDRSYTFHSIACSRAYSFHYREPLPDELHKKWDDERPARL